MVVHLMSRYWDMLTTKWSRHLYFVAFLLLAFVTLGSLMYAALLLWHQPYMGLTWNSQSGLVYDVDADSPAARVDIRPGDRILRVNGLTLSQARLFRDLPGHETTMTFTIARSERVITAPVHLSSPPWRVRVQRLVPLLVALVFWGISLGVWAFHHGHRVTRLFFLTSQVTTALLTTGAMSIVYTPYTFWSRVAFSLLLLTIAPLTLHFFTWFPQEVPRGLRQRMVFPAYGMALLLGVMTLLTYEGYFPPEWLHQPLNRVYVAAVFILALFVVLRRWGDASLQVLRSRRLLAMGMGISIMPLLFLSFIPDTLLKAPLVDYTWTFLFLTAIPVIYARALGAGELGTVDWVLSRTLAHLVLSGIFSIVYLVLFLWIDDIVPLAAQTSPLIVAGLAVAAAALFAPTRRYLLHLADRFLYGGWYDYRTTLQALSQKLRGAIRVEDLADLLVGQVCEALRLRGAVLLLVDDGHLVPMKAIGVFARPLPPPLPVSGSVGEWLVRTNKPITPAQMRRALGAGKLTQAEVAWIHLSDVTLWLPLIHGGDLKGLLLLGTRISGDPLEPEDLRLLDILAAHAATAAENIRLVENLRARVEEVKQLYAQLAQAREEERKHLARELHDVVLQDVINAYVSLDQVLAATDAMDTEQLCWAHDQILRTIRTLRRLCTELRPPALDITDLRSAIEGLVDDVRRESGLAISLSFPEGGYHALDGLPDAVSITLYRVLQETLTNVRRHAQAHHVHVRVSKGPEWIGLEVEDDGRGFVVPSRLSMFVREHHYGLAGLEERVQGVGGTLDVRSTPERGTRVRVRLPLQGN